LSRKKAVSMGGGEGRRVKQGGGKTIWTLPLAMKGGGTHGIRRECGKNQKNRREEGVYQGKQRIKKGGEGKLPAPRKQEKNFRRY